ncbi:EFR1 family ferrodoxin [Parabacteroides sp. PF5-9]|uniref:EFR1 family ferrodoxin n=1 Tax=Parabacteroides sp. PF5-9 TaxID=1742404 RepID=UPI00247678B1|nr:EFR1 family ferrodoxin [Parabacteroides sp. PF5-9]MDH6356453.1 ferredoxin [Parabacteroides sp. PF5-9]
MIFYFTGTGNSLYVAQALGDAFNETLSSITEELSKNTFELSYVLQENEKVFFVYPVHSWGPSVFVMRFISRLRFENYDKQAVYSVCTCGDECGYTTDILKKSLNRSGISLSGSYSVEMPNNYVLLPGFDVDSKEIEKQKLEKSASRIKEIIQEITNNSSGNLYQTGSLPFLKSRIIYPLFSRYAIGRNSFYATEACIACGLCERVCPTQTITLSETGKPLWGNTCVQCVACIHRCPVRAIEYGKGTIKKGRYHHPIFKHSNK